MSGWARFAPGHRDTVTGILPSRIPPPSNPNPRIQIAPSPHPAGAVLIVLLLVGVVNYIPLPSKYSLNSRKETYQSFMSKKRLREERDKEQAAVAEATSIQHHKLYRAAVAVAVSGTNERYVDLTPQQASRLLYPNPVCFLTTITPKNTLNVMSLSWLAPANNYGGFVFVVHKTRYSAECLLQKGEFMLSVATSLQIDLLLKIGKVSGSSVDKYGGSIPDLQMQSCQSNKPAQNNTFSALENSSDSDSEEDDKGTESMIDKSSVLGLSSSTRDLIPIEGAAARIKCKVKQHFDAADAGHWLVIAQIEEARVHPNYWDGKVFAPVSATVPGLLSFLGSQKFSELKEVAPSSVE